MRQQYLSMGVVLSLSTALLANSPRQPKEWAFLIFLNGHNNLAQFSDLNINQLETVGSTDDVDVIVQWAKTGNDKTYRLKVMKDADDKKVTSPFVEQLPRVDMGDYKQLVEFVRWSAERYPAKHYFVSFWNHGSGWTRGRKDVTRGVSYDDYSGNHITTEQMGMAMKEISAIIGHKVDIVGADACLMAMAEVASEMQDSVQVYVSSEELVPGLGWPYHTFYERWAKNPMGSAATIGSYLVEEYYKYLGKEGAITLSALDLTKLPTFWARMTELGGVLNDLSNKEMFGVSEVMRGATGFTSAEAIDIGDWLNKVERLRILDPKLLNSTHDALKDVIVSNKASGSLAAAEGLSFWVPRDEGSLNKNFAHFQNLRYAKETSWGKVLTRMSTLPVCELSPMGQWGAEVLNVSSQYGQSEFSGAQALGACNTKRYGDFGTAWAPKEKDAGEESISLGFKDPVYSTGAIVRETSGSGFLKKIEAIDMEGGLHSVWQGEDSSSQVIKNFEVKWSRTSYKIKGLKITIDTKRSNMWEEIDSVQLLGEAS